MPKNHKMIQEEVKGMVGGQMDMEKMSMHESGSYHMTPPTDDYPKIISHVNTQGATEGVKGPNSPASFRAEAYDEKLNPDTNLRAQFVSDTVEKTEGRI